MLADAGYAAQALLDAAAASSERSGQIVRDRLKGYRARAVSRNLNQTLNQTLGDQELTPTGAFTMNIGSNEGSKGKKPMT